MTFKTPLSALEFYCGQMAGDVIPVSQRDRQRHVYDMARCVTADIGAILKSFPQNIQRSLIDAAYHGITTSFTKTTLDLFRQKLDAAGYMKISLGKRVQAAA